MARNGMWVAPDIVPTITYTDLPRAIEWLQRVFGFRERKGHGHDLGYNVIVLEDACAAFTPDQRRHVLEDVIHHYGGRITVDKFVSHIQGESA